MAEELSDVCWRRATRLRNLRPVTGACCTSIPSIISHRRVILLDDVITEGSTLSVAVAAIKAVNPTVEFVITAAGQMIVMAVVANQNGPAW